MTKPTHDALIELFRRTSDCFAQTIDDSRIAAMTEERFVEVIEKLYDGRLDDIKPTVWMAGSSDTDTSQLSVSMRDVETGEELLKPHMKEFVESWVKKYSRW